MKKFLLISCLLITIPSIVNAKATGVCSDCHTMHNSQGGVQMFTTTSGALTNGGCVGCHTGSNDGSGNIPFITDTTEPSYESSDAGTLGNTLAGGSFYWVGIEDAKGHNVIGIVGDDAIGMTPPGWSIDFNGNGSLNNDNLTWTTQLTCAGTNGCHGDHNTDSNWGSIAGAHHGSDDVIDGDTIAGSFRFLKGVLGLEDSGWEYQPTETNHNQYYGVDKTSDLTTSLDTGTISYLCAECHGNFHSGDDGLGAIDTPDTIGSPWIRHPTDFDMGSVASKPDYSGYGGGGHTYSVIAPVASEDVSTTISTVYNNSGDAVVMCLSCHRAHGTPFDDLLRWDYDTCSSASGNDVCGCFECHTTKDDI